MPGFIYEVDKLGNKVISRDPNVKRKSDKKFDKAVNNYN
jgi:hypothetical protein